MGLTYQTQLHKERLLLGWKGKRPGGNDSQAVSLQYLVCRQRATLTGSLPASNLEANIHFQGASN